MLVPQSMSGKKVGILGLGLSGMAAARALSAAGAMTWLHDDHGTIRDEVPPGASLCGWQDWPWDELSSLVISPGIPHAHPEPHPAAARAAAAGVEVISEIEIAMRAAPEARIVAITGTNGKSTTTALTGHCLRMAARKVAVGGNIGDAACNLDDPGADGVIVLELSSYQLETTPSLRADVAMLLNITPDHLVRHGGMDGYVAAKARILDAAGADGLVIMGPGAPLDALARRHRAAGGTVITVTATDAPAGIGGVSSLAGDHNAENAAAAAACLATLGLDGAEIARGMASFAGLPHRLQTVAKRDRISFVNDSKATNGVAAAKALGAFENIYWIAGGEAKEDGLGPAADAAAQVTHAYLIGSAAPDFAAELDGRVEFSLSGDLETATTSAFADASAATTQNGRNATILLSPAAASFDQFASFVARGEAFAALAGHLTGDEAGAGLQPDIQADIPGGAHA